MNIKYKKVVIATATLIMGISLLIFPLDKDNNIFKKKAKEIDKTLVNEDLQTNNAFKSPKTIANNNQATKDKDAQVFNTSTEDAAETTSNQAPEPTPEPTPLPVYDLEENTIPEIEELIKEYFLAKINCDSKKMKKLVSDKSVIKDEETLQKEIEHIEDFRNIKVYVKKGLEEGSYLTYIYHEVKFTSINTLAPGLSKFYIITDDKGNLKIFSGQLDDETATYNLARNEDEDVEKLIKKTNKKGKTAKEKDEDLAAFWESIDKLGKSKNKK